MVVLLLLLAARWAEERPLAAGALAGFAAWCRPDAALAVGLLGLLLWRERRRLPWRYGAAALLVLGTGALLALAYFGSAVPNSWRAKQAEATVLGEARGRGRTSGPRPRRCSSATSAPPCRGSWLLGLAGLWPLFRHGGRPGRLMVLNALALSVAYPVLGVNFAAWYVLPMIIALLYGVAFAAGAAGRALAGADRLAPGRVPGPRRSIAPALLSIAPRGLAWYRHAGAPLHFAGYRDAGLWIRRDSRPGDAIASMEVGTLAYFSGRRVEDLQGLVTPRSIPFTARGDPAGAFLASPARYVVVAPGSRGRWRRSPAALVPAGLPGSRALPPPYLPTGHPGLPAQTACPSSLGGANRLKSRSTCQLEPRGPLPCHDRGVRRQIPPAVGRPRTGCPPSAPSWAWSAIRSSCWSSGWRRTCRAGPPSCSPPP